MEPSSNAGKDPKKKASTSSDGEAPGKSKTASTGKSKTASTSKARSSKASGEGQVKSAKASSDGQVKSAKASGTVRARSSAVVPASKGSQSYVLVAVGLLAVGVVAAFLVLSSGTPPPQSADSTPGDGPADGPRPPGNRPSPRPTQVAGGAAEPSEQARNALAQGRLEMKAGNYAKALEAFAIAESGGVPKTEIAPLRAKCQELIAADKKWKQLVANVKDLEAKQSWDEASEMLRLAEPLAIQLGHESDLKDLVREVDARGGSGSGADGDPVITDLPAQIADALALGDVKKATELLAFLTKHHPDDPQVPLLTKRVERVARTPPGTNYVEIDAAQARGVYVPRKAVSNADWKLWWSSLPKDSRPPAPWPGGDYAGEEGAFPVTNVREEDAARFAKARGGRLPTAEELAVVKKQLRLSGIENALESGVYTGPFRFVIDAGSGGAPVPNPANPPVGGPPVVGPDPVAPPVGGPEPVVGGDPPGGPRPARNLAKLETDLKERTKAWLQEREQLVCADCKGKGFERCRACDGKGYVEGTSVTHPTKCPTCHGDLTIPCSRKCKKGLSRSMLDRTTKKFGALGQALKHAKPGSTPVVKLDPADPTHASVTTEVQYIAMAEGYCAETSQWQLDAKTNAWMCTEVTDGVKKDD